MTQTRSSGTSLVDGARARFGRWGAPAALGIANQVVSSGTTLALTLLLVRTLSPAEFGAFGLGYGGAVLLVGLGNGLFITQMVVHLPDRPFAARAAFVAEMLVGLSAASVVVVAASGLTALAAPRHGGWGVLAAVAPAAAIAAAGMLLRDFAARHAFSERKEWRALTTNVVATVSLAVLLGLADRFGGMAAPVALSLSGVAMAVGGLAGIWLSRIPLRSVTASGVKETWRSVRWGGCWASGGVAATWIQTQAYSYATAAVADLASVGQMNAARLFVSPLLFLVPTVNQFLMPRLAERRVTNPKAAFALQRSAVLAMVVASVGYGIVALALPDDLLSRVVGPKYTNLAGPLAAWMAYAILTILRDSASVTLQVFRAFRELTLYNLVSAPIAAVAALALAIRWGGAGAVLGGACGEAALAALLWMAIGHERRKR